MNAGEPSAEPSGGVTQPSGSMPMGVAARRSGRAIFSSRHGAGAVTTLWIGKPNASWVITEDAFGFPIHKVVTTPAPWRLLKIDRPLRLSSTPTGIEPDGWVTPTLGSPDGSPAFAAYNQFSTPGGKPGLIRIIVSRAGWQGTDKPGKVTIKVGHLVRGADNQPALGKISQVLRWTIHSGKTRIFDVRAVPPTRIELTVSPTFSPHEFGGSDRRQLGAQVSFSFVPVGS